MKTRLFSIIIISLMEAFMFLNVNASQMGSFTSYQVFSNITEIESAGNVAYVLASGSLYSVNTETEEVRVFDKSNSLSDCSISHIAWCATAGNLVILYTNHNIDLLDENGNTRNISDYYSKSMTVDKTVNQINVSGKYAYLSTNFGIVQIDVENAVIQNTFILGFKVNWTHSDSDYLYAESADNGQWRASLKSNLLDMKNWEYSGNYKAEGKTLNAELKKKVESYRPDGPKINYFYDLVFRHNILYTVPGSSGNGNAYTQNYDGSKWNIIDSKITYLTERRFRNPYSIVPFPDDPNHWYIGAESGLYEVKDGKYIKEYWWGDGVSTLQYCYSMGADNTKYSIVRTAALDSEGSLWCINGEAPVPGISRLAKNGKWSFYPHDELWSKEGDYQAGYVEPAGMFFDSRGLMWFVNQDWRTPVAVRYNTETDKATVFKTFRNQDGTLLTVLYVNDVAEDREGNIWLATDIGPLEILASDVLEDSPVVQQVKVPRNDGTNLADYLLSGINISCIAIDGANRKVFGSAANGVYIISSDCLTEQYHYTAENSDLLANDIAAIAIDGTTGEVYVSTGAGLCSFRSDASDPEHELDSSKLYSYPNPVTPDYTGLITVKGFSFNAYVKIVSASGTIVAEGQSSGGTFTWDGKDLDGNKVASGVYTVLAADEDVKKTGGCKIAIVR